MLHESKLLFWLRSFVTLSISVSLTGSIKIEFNKIFFKYLPKGFFAFGILDARFESTFTKKIKCLSDGSFICNNISIYKQRIWRGFGFGFQCYN